METKTQDEISEIQGYVKMFGEESASSYFKININEIRAIAARSNDMDQSNKRKHSDRDYDRDEKRYRSKDRSRESKRDHSRDKENSREKRSRSSKNRSRERKRDRSRERKPTSSGDRSKNGNYKSNDRIRSNSDGLSDISMSNDELNEIPIVNQSSTNQQVDQQLSNHTQELQIDQSIQNRWVSSYLNTATNDDDNKDLDKNFIYNSFKTLIKAKKRFMDTENLISIVVCNLKSDANDIFVYPNDDRTVDDPAISKNCLKFTIFLACSSNGIKFKPAFMLNHVKINSPLIKNDNIEHVSSIDEWLDLVLKTELEKNMIYNCICSLDNQKLWLDDDLKEKFKDSKCELIVIPNSTIKRLSPYQHSLFLILNGILHKKCFEKNKFPVNLDQSIELFQESWNQLTEGEIINSFEFIVNTCVD